MKDIAAVAVYICAVAVRFRVAGAYPEIGRPFIVESFSIGSRAGSGRTHAYGGSYNGRQLDGHVFNASKGLTSFSANLVVPQNSFNYGPQPSNTDISSQSFSRRLSRQNMPNVYLPPMRPGYLSPPSPFDQTGIQNARLSPSYKSGYPGNSNMLSPQGKFLNAFNSYPDKDPSPFGESSPYNIGQTPSFNEIGQTHQGSSSPDGFNPTNSRKAQKYPGLKMVPISVAVPNSQFFPDQVPSQPEQAFGPPGIDQSYMPPGFGQVASPLGQAFGPPGIGNSYTTPGIGQVASPLGQAFGPPGIGQSYMPPGFGQADSPLGQAFGPPGIGQSYTPPGIGQIARPQDGQGQSFIPPAIGQPSLGVGPAMFSGSFPPSLSLLNADPLVPAAQSIVQFTSNPANSEYFFSYIVADPVTSAYYRYQELRVGDVVNGFYIVIHPDTHVQTTVFEADENGARKATTLKRYRRDINSVPDDA